MMRRSALGTEVRGSLVSPEPTAAASSPEAENRHSHGGPNARNAVREKPAMRRVGRESLPRDPYASEKHHAENKQETDRQDFDQRKPVFGLTETSYVQDIDRQQSNRKPGDPNPGWDVREPEAAINGDSHNLAADGYDLGHAVGVPRYDSRPGSKIVLGVHPEGPGCRMGRRHFREGQHDGVRDQCSDRIRQNDGGPRHLR